MAALKISIADRQSIVMVDRSRLKEAVKAVLAEAQFERAEISVAIIDDPTIHELNRRFLDHDYPTDVLSFPLGQSAARLEGEIVASAETAAREAQQCGWPADDELLLYIVHGALHLVGYDDDEPDAQRQMQAAERRHLAAFGLVPPNR